MGFPCKVYFLSIRQCSRRDRQSAIMNETSCFGSRLSQPDLHPFGDDVLTLNLSGKGKSPTCLSTENRNCLNQIRTYFNRLHDIPKIRIHGTSQTRD